MSTITRKIRYHPKYNKARQWGQLVAVTGGVQAVVQVTGLLSGILIIRLLPTQEYAYYTIANTMLGTMTLLSDAGISTGVMAQGGKVWQDREKLGTVLATGLDLRKKFAVGSLLVSLPILAYLLFHQGSPWLATLLIVLSLIPSFLAALSDSTLEIVPKLHQDIGALQRNQMWVSVGRLLTCGLGVALFPWTAAALLANGLPRAYGNIRLKVIAQKFAEKTQKANGIIRNEILKIVKRALPAVTYHAFSGQISIWLISIFGKVQAIAGIGALGRLAVLVNFFSILVTTLLIPRFSRMKEVKNLLLKFYINTILGVAMLSIFLVMLTYMFSHQILWVLGDKYKYLNDELVLSMVASCINLLAGISFFLYSSKGWIIEPITSITISAFPIVLGILIFDYSTLKGILKLNILVSSVAFFLHCVYGYYKILNLNKLS